MNENEARTCPKCGACALTVIESNPFSIEGSNVNWREFEELARKAMTRYFGVKLVEKNPKGFPKRFDMVSADENIIGDAKYLTLVHRKKFPPAKMMEISGHVWLLEKVNAKTRFLVFGNQRSVPEKWLDKYGNYARSIDFYFIDAHENVEKMRKNEAGARAPSRPFAQPPLT